LVNEVSSPVRKDAERKRKEEERGQSRENRVGRRRGFGRGGERRIREGQSTESDKKGGKGEERDVLSSTLEIPNQTANFRWPVVFRFEIPTADSENAVGEEGRVERSPFEAGVEKKRSIRLRGETRQCTAETLR
jgi:hypothetical protein